jgi:hypothetical protein
MLMTQSARQLQLTLLELVVDWQLPAGAAEQALAPAHSNKTATAQTLNCLLSCILLRHHHHHHHDCYVFLARVAKYTQTHTEEKGEEPHPSHL